MDKPCWIMRLPQIRFVVDGLLPQGLHILAGAAKTGKSWLLLLLSLRVAQGKPFWNLQTEKGTVLSLCRGQPQPYPAAADGSD